ncbi:glycoside hydrolase family 6 protein [Streptomyces sp. NBC_00083]|uniref:glycoside hydrolase family 6 protein n=1 Tax=Streptomyces sp. NBC_00083 TaxID=2975647 RepID=UPI00225B205B|nr:glycoside hydrolase family 6 protein [Streptomyces sp. NBC_00083]MCX5382253.1 glycoside hydrolase family 6 protein [Streptomyces sp. NBC_00083]
MYGSRAGSGVRIRVPAVALALLAAGCGGGDGGGGAEAGESAAPSGLAQPTSSTSPFWVDPDTNAARQLAAYTRAGDSEKAALIRKIAEQPAGEWIAGENPEGRVRGYTQAATRAGRTALLVLYNIPHRDCGQFSRGGAPDDDAYRDWVDQVARGIGERPAAIVLEPDALLHVVDGCTPAEFREARYALLKGAVDRLKRQPGTRVYVDAGNAGWRSPDALDEPLRRAGIAGADGFAVNVSNFQTTRASREFGEHLSAKVGGKHFVIDTSRNGNGPYAEGDPAERWCNPPGRALGERPTADTGGGPVDAYVWAKRPGESDGPCKGGPPAGKWWPEYALSLAGNTR